MNNLYYPIGEFTESVRLATLYLGILIMIIIIKKRRAIFIELTGRPGKIANMPREDGERERNRNGEVAKRPLSR